MDANIKLLHTFPSHVPLPYYMDYAGYRSTGREQELLRDMEYLHQMYPGEVKRYQKRIAQMLDQMDYEGSMIYDEYPDYTSLRGLADSMVRVLRQEDDAEPDTDRYTRTEESWELIRDMVQVLLCDEICKRRHGGRRGNYFWMNG